MKTDFGGTDDLAYAMARDASGGFVLAGYAGTDLTVARYHGVTPAGTPGTQPQWVQQDANFNVTSIADSSGNVLERYRYTPYGERTVLNAAGSAPVAGNASAYGMQHGHQGGRADAATGLILYNVGGNGRYYSPTLGRWTSRDRAQYIDGLSLFLAYLGNPLRFKDPYGLHIPDEERPPGSGIKPSGELTREELIGGPGPYAKGGVHSSGPRVSPGESDAIQKIGNQHGCHTCGAKSPGGNGTWIGDHQPPSGIGNPDEARVLYPQCKHCSNRQGGFVGALRRAAKRVPASKCLVVLPVVGEVSDAIKSGIEEKKSGGGFWKGVRDWWDGLSTPGVKFMPVPIVIPPDGSSGKIIA